MVWCYYLDGESIGEEKNHKRAFHFPAASPFQFTLVHIIITIIIVIIINLKISQCDCKWNDQSTKSRTLCFALTNADKGLQALLIRKCQDRGRDRIMIECIWQKDKFLGYILENTSYREAVINACNFGCFTSISLLILFKTHK